MDLKKLAFALLTLLLGSTAFADSSEMEMVDCRATLKNQAYDHYQARVDAENQYGSKASTDHQRRLSEYQADLDSDLNGVEVSPNPCEILHSTSVR